MIQIGFLTMIKYVCPYFSSQIELNQEENDYGNSNLLSYLEDLLNRGRYHFVGI